MEGIKVISKGNYSHSQPKNIVAVKRYLFVSDSNKDKFILLHLANDRRELLSRVKLCVTQYDGNGEEISSVLTDSGDLNVKPLSGFSFNQKIELNADCVDFKVRVIEAIYGNYCYSDVESEIVVSYRKNATPISNSAISVSEDVKHKGKIVNERFFMKAIVPTLIAVFAICIALTVTLYQVNAFKEAESDFIVNGVKYCFVNADDKSEGALVEVVGYNGNAQNVEIDKTIDGYVISSIKERAFFGNKKIKTLVINGDIEIGADAFGYCANLYSVKIPEVKKIGYASFEHCDSLKTFESSALTEIGEWAFFSCQQLESVQLTNSEEVLSLGKYAFYDCKNLKNINFDQYVSFPSGGVPFKNCNAVETLSLKNYNFSDEALGITNKGQAKISALFGDNSLNPKQKSLKTLFIENVDEISTEFCLDQSIESLEIKNLGSSEISDYAFKGCYNLSLINLPIDVTAIGDEAFSGTSISAFSLSKVTSIGKAVFENCANLRKITIPDNFETITESLFRGCENLDSVVFGDESKLLSISDGAFSGCKALKRIKLPKSVVEIGNYAFSGCSSMKAISVPTVLTLGNHAFENCEEATTITLSAKLTRIGDNCFNGCSLVKSLVIPKSVTSMGGLVFGGMENLQLLTIPYIGKTPEDNYTISYLFGTDSLPKNFKKVTVTDSDEIKEAMFADATTLQSVAFLKDVTSIGSRAFYNCKELQSFEIPSYIESTGVEVFYGCENLESINVQSLTEINSGMFYGCKNLKDVEFSAELTAIGKEAFKGCESLTSIDLSLQNNLSSILDNAFENCYSLIDVSISNSAHIIGGAIFKNCVAIESITMPFVDAYENGDANIFTQNSSLKYYFGLNANNPVQPNDTGIDFAESNGGSDDMVKQIIPATLKKVVFIGAGSQIDVLEKYVFDGAEKVEEITISEGITTIESNAMEYLGSLTKLWLPSTLNLICENAFIGCNRLYEIYNNSLVTINAGEGVLGDVSFNALLVHSKEEINGAVPERKMIRSTTLDGFEFACVDKGEPTEKWFLIGHPQTQNVEIPNSFVYYENGNANLGEEINYFSLVNCLFFGDDTLESLSLSFAVDSLGKYLAKDAVNLKSVTLDECYFVEEIPTYAFSGCESLERVVLPDCIQTIRAFAFENCFSLYYFELGENVSLIEDNAFINNRKLFNVVSNSYYITITARATDNGGIARYARNVTNQGEIRVPSSAINEEGLIFQKGSDNVWYLTGYEGTATELTISMPYYDLKSGYIFDYIIDNNAFENNSTLEALTLSGVSAILENAFNNCISLNSLTFVDCGLTTISQYSFVNCTTLQTLRFVNCGSLTQIEGNAFYNCSALNEVVFSEGLESVMENAFIGSTNLSVLQIPRSLSSVALNAFGSSFYYSRVKYVYFMAGEEDVNVSVREQLVNNFYYGGYRLYYYSECIHDDNQWNLDSFGRRNTEISEVKEILSISPSCIQEGLNEYRCKNCNELIETREIPMFEHTFDVDGICLNCGFIKNEINSLNFNSVFSYNQLYFSVDGIGNVSVLRNNVDSSLQLTAPCDMTLSFWFEDTGNGRNVFNYTINDESNDLSFTSYGKIYVFMNKGDTFTLTVNKKRGITRLSNIVIAKKDIDAQFIMETE